MNTDQKAILAVLHHFIRCPGPEPNRPPEVKQGMGEKGWFFWMDHCYSLQALHAQIQNIALNRKGCCS